MCGSRASYEYGNGGRVIGIAQASGTPNLRSREPCNAYARGNACAERHGPLTMIARLALAPFEAHVALLRGADEPGGTEEDCKNDQGREPGVQSEGPKFERHCRPPPLPVRPGAIQVPCRRSAAAPPNGKLRTLAGSFSRAELQFFAEFGTYGSQPAKRSRPSTQ